MSIVRALKSKSILCLDREATNTWATYIYFEYDLLQNKKLFIEIEKNKFPIQIIDKPLKQTNFKNN